MIPERHWLASSKVAPSKAGLGKQGRSRQYSFHLLSGQMTVLLISTIPAQQQQQQNHLLIGKYVGECGKLD